MKKHYLPLVAGIMLLPLLHVVDKNHQLNL